MSGPILSIRNLSVSYDRIEVVHGVNVDVTEGRVVGLIGANGAGKSTIMRAIMGQRDVSGVISLRGKELQRMQAHQIAREGVALVPEGRMVFPNLSVKNNLRMGAYAHRKRWGATNVFEEVMELFPELKPTLGRPAGVLSGGQQQMVAVGRALMGRPTLLMLDEPSMGLGPLVIERIYETIRYLKSQKISIVLAEQNARMALTTVDDVYVLQNGTVMESGTADDLRDSNRIAEIYLGRKTDAR